MRQNLFILSSSLHVIFASLDQNPLGLIGVFRICLKAGQGVTVDSNSYINQWDDNSGNANNFSPASGVLDARKPKLIPSRKSF